MASVNYHMRTESRHENTGKEIFEIHPVVLGGSATDPTNKVALTREQHIAAVRYWNKVISDMREVKPCTR